MKKDIYIIVPFVLIFVLQSCITSKNTKYFQKSESKELLKYPISKSMYITNLNTNVSKSNNLKSTIDKKDIDILNDNIKSNSRNVYQQTYKQGSYADVSKVVNINEITNVASIKKEIEIAPTKTISSVSTQQVYRKGSYKEVSKPVSTIENHLSINSEKKESAPTNTISSVSTKQVYIQGSYVDNSKVASVNKSNYSFKPVAISVIKTKTPASYNNEAQEYDSLMSSSQQEHKDKTVQILNKLFDNDPTNKDAILMVKNNSDCNMILRLKGNLSYNLAIPKLGENSIVLPKGEYIFSSNICNMKYFSTKSIVKNLQISLKQ